MPSYAITCHNVTSHDITAISFPIKHISLEMVKQKAFVASKNPALPAKDICPAPHLIFAHFVILDEFGI